MSDAPPPAEPMELLSAFLDGELNVVDEAALLRRLEQEPALQDALDALAETMAAAQSVLRNDELNLRDEIDILSTVMAGLAAKDVADTVEGTETLAWLVADGAANAEQLHRLDTLLNRYPDEATEALAFVEAARATLSCPAEVMQAALSRLPDHIGARVARAERGWSLSAGAADGALSAAEIEELVGLASNDDGLADSLEAAVAARVDVAGVDRAVTEALLAFAGSVEVEVLAARAGAAAVQAIAAEAAQQTSRATTTTATTATSTSISVWAKLRSAFTQGWLPLAAAGAAAVAFMVVDVDGDVATDRIAAAAAAATIDQAAKLAEFRDAFMQAVEPVAMANNTILVDSAALPVLADNGADVETLDAAGNTMVFQTAESNITIIWVAGLDDDDAEEQGT